MFAGRLHRCNDETVYGVLDCVGTFTCDELTWGEYAGGSCTEGETHARVWGVAINNFDNVPIGFLTLFEVATLEGWVSVMHRCGDFAHFCLSVPYFSFVFPLLFSLFPLLFSLFAHC